MEFKDVLDLNGILEATKKGFIQFFNFRGKQDRLSFIHFLIGTLAAVLVVNWFFDILGIRILQTIITLATLLCIIPVMAAVSRRFNDKGKKAWPFILLFIGLNVLFISLELFDFDFSRQVQTAIEYGLFVLWIYSFGFPLYFGIMEK